jgi:O-acetyl-ADP-ribose deacetylase (regulator of RNase III)
MMEEHVVANTTIRVEKGDITDQEIDAFVYYATEDLKLGSGFGTAISSRGGPTIQKELDEVAPAEPCTAVISNAGTMKAGKIIHAVGPKFQEKDIDAKLRTTVENALRCADQNGIARVAFPPMGTGFYGVPLDTSASIMLGAIKQHLSGETSLKEIVIYVADKREFDPFQARLAELA